MRRLLLADYDPQAVTEYNITADDLRRVVRYLWLLQGPDALTLRDIAIGGYYGTSALLHEVVELDILLEREPRLLKWSREAARDFLEQNQDAHVEALKAEYTYLRWAVGDVLGQKVSMGALILANTVRRDFWLLAESDWHEPLFYPQKNDVVQAVYLLNALRQLGKGETR